MNSFIQEHDQYEREKEQKENEERTYNKRVQREEICVRVYIDRRVQEKG